MTENTIKQYLESKGINILEIKFQMPFLQFRVICDDHKFYCRYDTDRFTKEDILKSIRHHARCLKSHEPVKKVF
jgi:hypothetical protein